MDNYDYSDKGLYGHHQYPAYPPTATGGYAPAGYPHSSSSHHSGHGPNMGTMLAGGAAAAAALYGAHKLYGHGHNGYGSHGHGYGHGPGPYGYGHGHSQFGYGQFGHGYGGKFKHGKFKGGKGGKFKKWK